MIADFHGTGMIVADVRQDGMTVWSRERLKILVKMRGSGGQVLSTLPGTPSGPAALLGFTARSTRLTFPTINGVVQEPGGGGGR